MPENLTAASCLALLRSTLLGPCVRLTLAALAWAGNAVIGRGLRQAYDPLELTFWRWSVACLCLYFCHANTIHAEFAKVRRNPGHMVAGGLCGMVGYHLLQYFALARLPASEVAVIVGVTPLTVTMARAVSRREWPRPLTVLSVGLGGGGLLLVCNRNGLEAMHDVSWAGVGAALAAMLCWSFYSMRSTRCEGFSWSSALFFMALSSSVVLSPFYLLDIFVFGTRVPDLTLGLQVLYLGVPASAVAYTFYNSGIERVGVVRAAQFNCLIPAFASILAAIFLGETITTMQTSGLVLVTIALNLVLVTKSSDTSR